MIGAIIAIGSALYSLYENSENAEANAEAIRKTAQANAELDYYNASVAESTIGSVENVYQASISQVLTETGALISSQRAAYASSGVDVTTGTPVYMADRTKNLAASDIQTIMSNQKMKTDQIRSEAERYRLAAKKGILIANYQASNVLSEAKYQNIQLLANGISTAYNDIYGKS